MGLLKHVLLPGFALMHGAAALACSDLDKWASMMGLKNVVTEDDQKSIRQNHMLGCLRGFNVAMMLLCGMSVVTESAHFRGKIILAEATLFSVVMVDAYRLGGLQWLVPGFHALVATAGAIINSMEPGIFAKDKTS